MQDKPERVQGSGFGVQELQRSLLPTTPYRLPTRSAFTLTELLIVIAIMAVLTGLIAAAATNAMRASRRNSITMEIKNISGALENFKNEYGMYPPNAMTPNPPTGAAYAAIANRVRSDFQATFKRAFPRSREPDWLVTALCGVNTSTGVPNLPAGMTAAEAVVFWLGGFSEDEEYPITGPGGPSFATNDPAINGVEVLENRNWRYEFDITRLGPRNDDDQFNGRVINYEINLNGDTDTDDIGEKRRINLWRFTPGNSEQPLVYFDVSRHKPNQYDMWAADPATDAPLIFAFKQLRSGVTTAGSEQDIVFVDAGKFQILHCGLDDAWGPEFAAMGLDDWQGTAPTMADLMLYPEGPYIGEIGDTLTSFTDGTIADAVEE